MTYRPNRSDHYQWKIMEAYVSTDFLSNFSNADGLNGELYNDQLLDLRDELKDLTFKLMERELTERQLIIIKLSYDGYTQSEIAKALNVNQSSINKSLNGNTDYRKGKKTYGGIIKKMRRLVQEDPAIQQVLLKIEELSDITKL